MSPNSPAPHPPAPRAAQQTRRGSVEHLRALYVQTPASLAGYVTGMVITAAIFWPLAEPLHMLGWVGFGSLLWLLRLLHYLRFRRDPGADRATLSAWRASWIALVLSQGSMWGLAVWLFWNLGTPYHLLSLILIVYAYCLASVQLLASQPRVFLGFISVVLVPTIARVASDTSHPWHLQLAVILAALFCIILILARTYGNALEQAITLNLRADELALRLRLETDAAEAARRSAELARRAAESANRAKTQFFAAASHDLRQPLHAMGLFAEALRQRQHEPDVAAMVNSINESVDALEGLFSELLDITRIDSGGVDVNPAPVRLREIFGRLRLHFEPIAFEKGLMLSFRGERHVAQADPVLLERVLRNLVSNALRYTDDGGVLVSCRPRAGQLLLQVWDSGVGIAQTSLPRIFDEFYQVQSKRALEPHHRKGLGLGLAIVKRLAALMNMPVTVRSRVGHGTVFTLRLGVAQAQPPMSVPSDPGRREALGLTLDSRRFVVVEDDPAVREGLVVLLEAWGAHVMAFDSLDQLLTALDAAQVQVPDLLLVDYRLPQGRTGIEALSAARQRWPDRHLPAIVITGSSLGGHEDEALAHDFHLLIKPVPPGKLRAMIGFKLGVR